MEPTEFLEVYGKGRACFSGKEVHLQQFQCQKHFLFSMRWRSHDCAQWLKSPLIRTVRAQSALDQWMGNPKVQ